MRAQSNLTKSLRSLCYTGIRLASRVRSVPSADLPFASGARMSTEILMPQLGESVVEGTVSRWLIAEGQPVRQDQPLLQITTDKVDTELPAPASGILLKIFVPEGQTVAKGTVLGVIGDQGSGIRDQGSGGQGSGVRPVDTPTWVLSRRWSAVSPMNWRRSDPGQRHRRGRPHHQEGCAGLRGRVRATRAACRPRCATSRYRVPSPWSPAADASHR